MNDSVQRTLLSDAFNEEDSLKGLIVIVFARFWTQCRAVSIFFPKSPSHNKTNVSIEYEATKLSKCITLILVFKGLS